MSGYALACFRGRYNNKHGLYVSEDFSLTGAKPTWTLYNDGLPETQGVLNNLPITMAVDPFDPMRRQWVNVDNNSIWHRDTSLGDDWFEILNLNEAYAISGAPAWSLTRSPKLAWVSCDRGKAGRIYTIYTFVNAQAAWWKEDWRVNESGGYVLQSDDYGSTWAVAGVFPTGNEANTYGTLVARRGFEVSGITGDYYGSESNIIWVGVDKPLLFGGGALCIVKAPGAIVIPNTSTTLKYSGWYAYAKVDPNAPTLVYSVSWENDSALMKVDGHSTERLLAAVRADGRSPFSVQDPLPLGSIHRTSSSDHHWIKSDTPISLINTTSTLYQRYLREDGRIFVTDTAWQFEDDDPLMGAINPEPQVLFPGTNTCRNLVASNSREGAVFFSIVDSVYGLEHDQSTTPLRLFTAEARSTRPGLPSYYGLYVDPDVLSESPGQPYVYSIDLGDEGTEDPDSSGIHQHGDNAAYDTEWQATEHARDIKTANFTYHNPYPGRPGDAPVSDGEKYVSTPILTLEPQVILYPADSTGIRYEFSVEGFNDAGEDAAAGDKIEVKGAGTLAGDLVLAEGVEYIGSKHILVIGTVYHGVDSIFTGFSVEVTETTEDAICIVGASEGVCYLHDCAISATSQSGDAFALSAELGGNIHATNCDLKAMSVSGDGYIGRSLRGKIKAVGGKVHASTDIWYIGD
jgi:hypothetical protein